MSPLAIFSDLLYYFSPLSDSDSGTAVFSRGETTAETETVTSANYSSDSAAVIKYKYVSVCSAAYIHM